MIKLSPRLAAVAALVRRRSVADVASDHALLPLFLLESGWVDFAVASDIKAGPLESARRNAAALGAALNIRLGDGLDTLRPGECGTLVIAGLGGLAVIDIISKGIDTARSFNQIIIQPQRNLGEVRRFLKRAGFTVAGETCLRDGGRFYGVLDCVPGFDGADYSDLDYAFGKTLLSRKDPALREYIKSERNRAERIVEKAGGRAGDDVLKLLRMCAEAERIMAER
jgi:tRNA (adenine22-N1)-methyltransferase